MFARIERCTHASSNEFIRPSDVGRYLASSSLSKSDRVGVGTVSAVCLAFDFEFFFFLLGKGVVRRTEDRVDSNVYPLDERTTLFRIPCHPS